MADQETELKDTSPDSSTGSEPAPDVTAKADPDSSSGKDVERKTLLEAVRDAVDAKSIEDEDAPIEKSEAKADPSPAEGAPSKSDPDSTSVTKDDVSDDALLATLEQLKADVPLGKIERFKEVLTENRQLKGAAERYKQLDQTLTEIGNDARRMGVSNDELAQLFAWPRLLAKDPKAAVEQLQTFAEQWREKTGHVLPGDLKQKVEDGLLDEATAKEVAQLRASSALSKTRNEADAAEREHQEVERRTNEIRDSVNAYQAELKKNDPDYTPEKHAMTVDALTALVTIRGVPQTANDARALAKEAYDTVTKRLSAFKPQPRAVANPAVGRRMNKPAESQPKTMLEAVELGLERAGRG